jgi:hypothetical protein
LIRFHGLLADAASEFSPKRIENQQPDLREKFGEWQADDGECNGSADYGID